MSANDVPPADSGAERPLDEPEVPSPVFTAAESATVLARLQDRMRILADATARARAAVPDIVVTPSAGVTALLVAALPRSVPELFVLTQSAKLPEGTLRRIVMEGASAASLEPEGLGRVLDCLAVDHDVARLLCAREGMDAQALARRARHAPPESSAAHVLRTVLTPEDVRPPVRTPVLPHDVGREPRQRAPTPAPAGPPHGDAKPSTQD